MKTKRLFIMMAATFLAVGISSCKKEGCTDALATNYNASATDDDGSCTYTNVAAAAEPEGYTPNFSSDIGVLAAIKSVSTTTQGGFTIDTEIGTGVTFFTEDGGSNFLEAGTISLNGETLTKNDNNSYTFIPSQASPMGISFASSVDWVATGGAWPAVSVSTAVGFSSVSDVNSGDVTASSAYTLNCSSISNADSVYFGIYGPDGSKFVVLDGATTSHTFSAADVSAVGAGQGFVQIVGLNYDPQTIGAKDYWLINETVRTKSVTIE